MYFVFAGYRTNQLAASHFGAAWRSERESMGNEKYFHRSYTGTGKVDLSDDSAICFATDKKV
jgi:hypothetical protein